MEVKASLKYLRISPRKVRLVTNLIKNLTVKKAEAYLTQSSKRCSKYLLKLLKSAVSNAEHNFHLNKDNLYVKFIRVDEGPALKRMRPRARGAAYLLRKRSSHIFLTLEETKERKKGGKRVPLEKEKIKEMEEAKRIVKKEEQRKEVKKKMKHPRYKKTAIEKEEKILRRPVQRQKIFRRKAI